jgi:hypothetical protein
VGGARRGVEYENRQNRCCQLFEFHEGILDWFSEVMEAQNSGIERGNTADGGRASTQGRCGRKG